MSLTMVLLLVVALAVGISIGAVGIGGILLIPALSALGHLGVHQAMATALFTFFFTGVLGAFLFQRRGSVDWRLTVPVCIGALLFGFVGAWTNARLDAAALTLILGAVIIGAGLYTLRPGAAHRGPALQARPHAQLLLLAAIGAFVGFGSGLTGVGGPAICVPVMVLFGFAPLPTIGVSQVVQIVASVSGSAANLQYGTIDFALAVPVTVAQLVGVPIGVRIVHALDPAPLRRGMAFLCIAVGAWLLVRVALAR
jgi:uncharacterized membrane protein YfcA